MNVNELSGTYRARAVEGALGKAKTGTEQVALVFQLIGDGPENGLRITWYGYFTEKTEARTVESLRICGWRGDDLSTIDTNFAACGANDNEVELVIAQEEQQDERGNPITRARVRWVNAPGSIGIKSKLSPEESKSFAQRMKARILAMEQGKPKANNTRRAPEPPPHDDKDAPPF